MMVLKRSMPEHLKGRFEKKTGRVLTQPCQGDQSKKLKCPTCGIIVKDLIRHTRERHRSTKLSETTGGKRPANSAPLGGSSDAKRQKEEMKTLAVNPLFQWSNADILQLTDDLLYKLQQERSRQDTGGIDREVMVRLGQLFMQRAFGVEVSRAPFLVDTDGNCLPNTLSYIRNPNQTAQMTAEAGTGLRQEVMGNVIEFIKEASMEELEPIQVAAAARNEEEVGMVEWLTRDELVDKLTRYKEDGTWSGDLGDIMPRLYASFTKSPIFIIVMCSDRKTMIGYFVNPSFNQPTLRPAASPVMFDHSHYEPLIVPQQFMEAWEAICTTHETQELAEAAIKVQLTDEDIQKLSGERRDATVQTPSTTEAEHRHQGQDDWSNVAGD